MDMRQEMMHRKLKKAAKAQSLPADSSWWKFFKTAMFGRNFINLNGRASRSEWWAVTVLSLILALIAAVAYSAIAVFVFHFNLDTASIEELNLFLNGANLINLIISVPGMAVSFRRFHDLDMSAWWSLLIIPNLALPFFKGKPEDNRFGANIC